MIKPRRPQRQDFVFMGGGVSDIFRFAKYERSATVFVKFSAYAESERNFALNARSTAHCEVISR